jgi:hypothetical protein
MCLPSMAGPISCAVYVCPFHGLGSVETCISVPLGITDGSVAIEPITKGCPSEPRGLDVYAILLPNIQGNTHNASFQLLLFLHHQ